MYMWNMPTEYTIILLCREVLVVYGLLFVE